MRDSDYILYIAERMGITDHTPEITFEDYLNCFENEFFNWFDFFNNTLKPPVAAPSRQLSLRQMQETLRVFSH